MASAKIPMLARSFASAASSSQMVKPPVQVFGIDGRYATALFSAASKQNQLDAVDKDLTKLQSALKTDVKFRDFVLNPTIKRAEKSETLKKLSESIKLSPSSSNLLQLLAENGRLKKLSGVINSFKIIMAAHKGEVTCEVTTAKELDSSQRQKLDQVLKAFVKPNESIQLTLKVDPLLIGGMVVSIGDRYVDMSVASKIKRYTELISASV